MNKTVILLLSGGIDSSVLLAKLTNEGYSVMALSFDYGQKHRIELTFAKGNAMKYGVKSHKIITLDSQLFKSSALVNAEMAVSSYESTDLPLGNVNTYVPFRNLMFISTALSLAENLNIHEIYIAVNKDDHNNFWDCKKDFIKHINQIAKLNTAIQIHTPFIDLTKKEIIRLAKQLDVNLAETITCYQPNGKKECGQCLSCRTKQNAMIGI